MKPDQWREAPLKALQGIRDAAPRSTIYRIVYKLRCDRSRPGRAALLCGLAVLACAACDRSAQHPVASAVARVFGGSGQASSPEVERACAIVLYRGELVGAAPVSDLQTALTKSGAVATWRRQGSEWVLNAQGRDELTGQSLSTQLLLSPAPISERGCGDGVAYQIVRAIDGDRELNVADLSQLLLAIELPKVQAQENAAEQTGERSRAQAAGLTVTAYRVQQDTARCRALSRVIVPSDCPTPAMTKAGVRLEAWRVPLDGDEEAPQQSTMLSGVGGTIASAQTSTASPSASLPAAPSAPRYIEHPPWLRTPTADELSEFYPDQALRENASGMATLQCTVTVQGRLTSCITTSEVPEELGFGQAALRVARYFAMGPVTPQGEPTAGGVVSMPIRFIQAR